MTRRALCFSLAFLLVSFSPAKDKPTFPKMIASAKFVLVTTYFGDNIADGRVPPADRQAVIDVQDAIRDWGHYTVVYERKAADLIILVRKGRIAETQDGIGIHAGSNTPRPSLGPITDADAGDPQDMLAVYNAALGIDNAPLWRDRMNNGLNAPELKLIRELRTKVEAAAKTP
ncbi:MAG TPA: hypothetical protein VH350_15015 [Candidatus Sulfotelmatobacter sp.]|jgi:hypothetical protein|nr:hypothetical protein [Candidatus Sulfotelmatobacter sp.]